LTASILSWWLISTVLAAAALPICWRIFSRLPDRGFGFSRVLGLLLCGYGYWIGASLQILPNSFGGMALVLLLVVAISLMSAQQIWPDILRWLKDQKILVLLMETLFLFAFIGWAWVRANNPEITGTEKPMELAFVNSILRSEGFPPRDPWLSGYAISYYYFGYVLLSFLTRLSGVTAGVGFNLGNSLWFALVAVGTYSILYNLINKSASQKPRFLPALLGPLMTLISGNLAGFLELLHSRHIFWREGAEGVLQSRFWTWIGLENLELAPIGAPSWLPQRYLWWWRSSRVIRDLDLKGVPIGTQSIDEFPFFSFLLADNHPHLLALPIVLLAMAFTLQVMYKNESGAKGSKAWSFQIADLRSLLWPWGLSTLAVVLIQAIMTPAGGFSIQLFFIGFVSRALLIGFLLVGGYVIYQLWTDRLPNVLGKTGLLFAAWLFGALAFLNTWDFPIYLSVLSLMLFWVLRKDGAWNSVRMIAPTIFSVVFLGVLFYLPWYPTFASQAGGILPHLLQPTRFPHFFIMFGPSLLPISIWLFSEVLKRWKRSEWRWILAITIGTPALLLLLSWLLAFTYIVVDGSSLSLDLILRTLGVANLDELIRTTLRIRFTGSWTALSLGAILAAAVVVLRRQWQAADHHSPQVWSLMAIIIGALLIIGPEFLYLRDQFGLRMNTIFKFYFAAWILWSLAGGFLLLDLWKNRSLRFVPLQIIALLPLLLGLIYPVLSVWTKTQNFEPVYGRSLDGSLHPSYMNDDDRDAIQWINASLGDGVIVEAVGGSYTYYTRVSTHTGLPTVLGWPGHEGQWRGGYIEQGSRQDDVRQIYQAPDWPSTLELLDRYAVDYVYLGELERRSYPPVSESKFGAFMELIYANETVRIYAREGGGSS
jgi:YYY domain-containing protein